MEMLRRPSAAALGIPTDPSAEAVDVVTAAPQPRWCHDDEHHRIALADGDVVLEQRQRRGVGQIIAARGFDRPEAVDASLDRRPVG